MSGWIKLQRDIMDHWIAQDCEYLAVWIRMLADANFETRTKLFNGQLITVERGQLIFGLDSYSTTTKVSVMRLRRLVELLEKDGMINRVKKAKYSIITIANYSKYQDENRVATPSEQAENTQTTGTEQAQNNTIRSKECKEDISSNEEINTPPQKQPRSTKPKAELDFSSWPQLPSDQTTTDWLTMRKRLKADVTQTVINRFATELTKAVAAGYTVDQCIAECCARNWKGFQLAWLHNAGVKTNDNQSYGPHGSTAGQGGYENPTARVMRMAREAEQQLQGNRGTVIEAEFKRS